MSETELMLEGLDVVTVIPARSGSERFPGKNMTLLQGFPLISYSLEYARSAIQHVRSHRIFISTNDAEVKSWMKEQHVNLIDRPDHLATSTSSTTSVLEHASKVIGDFDFMVLLQPTNPLRPAGLIADLLQRLLSERRKSGFTVSPLHKKLGAIEGGSFIPQNYTFGQRSQDMEKLYYENGLLYIASKEMIDQGELMNQDSLPYIVDHPFASVDIDYPEDILWAENVLKRNA